jgi:hypothetical protein
MRPNQSELREIRERSADCTEDYPDCFLSQSERDRRALLDHIDAEEKRYANALLPVRNRYDGDGEITDVAAMLSKAVIDLMSARHEVVALRQRLRELESHGRAGQGG